jgi:hypothetical protein
MKLYKEEITTNIKHKHVIEKEINITNKGKGNLELNIEKYKLENILDISKKNITLLPGEIKTIKLTIKALESSNPDIYIGKIIFFSGNVKKEILVVVNIESEQELFDVYLGILNNKNKIYPETILLLKTELFNLGETEEIDAFLRYEIKNSVGETVSKEESTVAVRTKTSLVESIKIPANLKPGKYIASVTVEYNGKIAIANESFEIKRKNIYCVLQIIIILLIIIIIILLIKRRKKKKKHYKSKKSKSRDI